ncbi:RNA polymerase sigma factor [Antribacter gilvus]|uniref:RNA polymerase sigma factor n=1 Tax=Antribacter gilvus TaxID=2304675 RepID=UPI001980062D|nr:RNA polymerase sigma factor [Antribacter gilvus]
MTARFVGLFEAEYPRVHAYLARRLPDRSAAEDLASEVFGIAWQRTMADGVPSPAWLFVTARNLLANHRRKSARREEIEAAVPTGVPADDDTADRVLLVLESLRPDHREVLRLRYWDELSGHEAAQVLDCSEGAVWVRLHRARRAFSAAWDLPVSSRHHPHSTATGRGGT